MNKKWIFTSQNSDDVVEQILTSRGIARSDWPNFLNPDFSQGLHDPFLLDGMDLAVSRIIQAIDNNEIVGIFADYDADGIPASALLAQTLQKIGLKTFVYIPSRDEGYGLNQNGIDELKKNGAKVLITVDLGIREIKNTEYAKSLGLDVIITDHHEPGEDIPKALAVINPKLKNSKYPFRELSGGGVAFKLIQALATKITKISNNDLKWMLDLVGITTICDVVPLVDENRIFAKFGLMVLQKTKRLGLKKLYEVSGIDSTKISTYTVGFQIGPRLNAPGRLNQKQESFELLMTTNEERAGRLAVELDAINKKRQDELERILVEARNLVLANKLNQKKVICLSQKDWPSGLIGLVAGKLVEEFSRPTIILEKGELLSKGSARSIDNYNIVEVFESVKTLLKSFGGHAKAAGLTIKNDQLENFYDQLLEIADTKLTDNDLVPKINIDMKLKVEQLDLNLFDEIQKLEPFGLGNPRPVFALTDIAANNIRTIGLKNNHLKFKVDDIDVIAFGMGKLSSKIIDQKFDLAFTIDENIWNGSRKLQLKVIDIKLSE